MKLTRRTFFKVTGAAGAAGVASATSASAAVPSLPGAEQRAVLVDTTKCIGCRACEAACSEANGLSAPELAGDPRVFEKTRTTDTRTLTIVNRHTAGADGGADGFVKRQCMHCVEPACASACLVRALEKTPGGPVVYHENRCLGCRYCMVACPFEMPRFEYEKAVPLVRKCTFCAERQAQGLEPACTSVCPSGAIQFGRRDALIDEAKHRIFQNPDKYVRHIYGEHEVGGTNWLYITDVPFEKLGLPENLGTAAAAGYAADALAGVPVIMTMGPALLMGLYTFAQRREQVAGADNTRGDEHHG